ncbi:hypothetical protein QVD17_25694 [Tagetes erecta]|uniref:GB1/RHD3-type G domain-containing protein n=1 Tax=Tagetes erecta TaxID=13708 RepID=A0AAD8KLH4_TARER|nr:hypothetical protein QVD17_25694 [Tagetes erecta]
MGDPLIFMCLDHILACYANIAVDFNFLRACFIYWALVSDSRDLVYVVFIYMISYSDTTTAECYTTQLIEGDGTFNGDELDDFIEQVKLAECGHSYVIVSIMGPQSSGKSTLLNHLFHANFKEMNVDMGRTQTTQGIWIARCVGIEPCTIVMDIEGTDGQERGETPLEVLESSLRNDIQKVEVVALSNYEYKEEEFKEQVATLRQKFIQSTAPGGLASDRRGVIPASGLSLSAKEIWKLVKGNEDLKLPTHMVT